MISRAAQFTRNLTASAALLLGLAAGAATPTIVNDVRLWSGPEGTRLVLDLSAPAKYEVFAVENPDRIVIGTEDDLEAARRYYNAVIRDYNAKVDSFPDLAVARLFAFRAREYFELEDAGERMVPQVKF